MLSSLWWPVIALMYRFSMFAADKTVMVVALIEWFGRCGFIPALDVILRSIFSSVLRPSGVEQYHTRFVAGLNALHGLLGFWNKLLHLGLRCDRYFSMSFTGQRFEPGLSNIFLLMVFSRQHCSALIVYFEIFFTIWHFPWDKHVLLKQLLVFSTSLSEE